MKFSVSLPLVSGALAMSLLSSTPAVAGPQVVYDNGPINGTIDAWTINFGYSVSDSFTVAQNTTLTGAQFGLWVFPGDTPTTVDWSIGSTPFANNISSGTAAPISSQYYGNADYFILEQGAIALNGVVTSGTTYYFTLQNLATMNGDAGYWDQNNGPSSGNESQVGALTGYCLGSIPCGSESFRLYGSINSASPVPEASTLIGLGGLLLGGGLLGLLRR